MTLSTIYLCAIPAKSWRTESNTDDFNISAFINDALQIERHIEKQVNLDNERARYTLICNRLQQEIMMSGRLKPMTDLAKFSQELRAGYFPLVICPSGYLSLLAGAIESQNIKRWGAIFYNPEQIEEHRREFETWVVKQKLENIPPVQTRLDFLSSAIKNKCGIIELQTSFGVSDVKREIVFSYKSDQEDEPTGFITIPSPSATELDTEFFGEKGRKQHLFKILVNQIQDALKKDEPVSFGNQAPHDVITEALNHFVYVVEGQPLRHFHLRVVYADGSEAKPFPLFCLHKSKGRKEPEVRPLKMALMSMRHLELDPEIDLSWFRNRNVSQTRTLAETDQYCFQATEEQLQAARKAGLLHVDLYHTGFEPAVIGFYRGVVNSLLNLRNTKSGEVLRITPLYYRGGKNYQRGSIWE